MGVSVFARLMRWGFLLGRDMMGGMDPDRRTKMEDDLIVAAHSDRLRVRIHSMPSGGFRVDVERLVEAEDAGGVVRGQFWSVQTGLTSYTDTYETARGLAIEKLSDAAP